MAGVDPQQPGAGAGGRPPWSSSWWTVRWLLPAVGIVIGLLIAARGVVVIGVLIAGLAVVRMVMLLSLTRRRKAFVEGQGARRAGGWDGGEARRRGLEVAAATIGVQPAELRGELGRGRTIAEVAAAHGVPKERVVSAMVDAGTARIDQAVTRGELASRQAGIAKRRLAQRVRVAVDRRWS